MDLDEGSALDPDSIKLLVRWIDDDLENGTPYEQSLILSAEEMNITPQEADKIYRANSPDSDYIPPVNFGDMDDVGLAPVDLDEGSALDPDSIKLLVRWIDDDLENGTPYEQSLILSAEEMNITPQEADKIYRANSPDSDYIPPVNFGDMDEGNAFSGKLAQARAQHKDKFDVDGHEYEVKEADAPVDEPTIEPVNNAHRNKYASMKASTMNPGEGDFGEKNMYGGRGDNRMTQQPNRPSKPVKSVKEAFAQMEAQLANEYESIKKVSK